MKWIVISYFLTSVCGTVPGAEAPPYFYGSGYDTLEEARDWAKKEKKDLGEDFQYWIVYGDPTTFTE